MISPEEQRMLDLRRQAYVAALEVQDIIWWAVDQK